MRLCKAYLTISVANEWLFSLREVFSSHIVSKVRLCNTTYSKKHFIQWVFLTTYFLFSECFTNITFIIKWDCSMNLFMVTRNIYIHNKLWRLSQRKHKQPSSLSLTNVGQPRLMRSIDLYFTNVWPGASYTDSCSILTHAKLLVCLVEFLWIS